MTMVLTEVQHLFIPLAAHIKFVSLVSFLLAQVHYGTMDTKQILVELFIQ